jgi:predicted RNA-binding Zn ribbon-like protein
MTTESTDLPADSAPHMTADFAERVRDNQHRLTSASNIGWAADAHLPVGEWLATTRFGLRPATHGLALVQDFLNTGAGQAPDLLADARHAEDWSRRAARAWSLDRGIEAQPPVVADGDAAKLRDLRALVRALVSEESPDGAAGGDLGAAAFTLSREGKLRWQPTGRGWRWWSAAICGEVLLSQHWGTWQRLKQCRNDLCRVVFYDRSWNNSGVWHTGTRCVAGDAALRLLA